MTAPIVDTVMGIDIWKEDGAYEIYDGMIPLEEYPSLEAARRGARQYAMNGTL
jgi:hypothetical protein